MQKNYLAIDIGASSGRHIVGWMENGVLRTEEVYRFPNSVQRVDGHLEWDIDSLFANVKQGIREAFAKYPNIESLSIDTWAVDYVLLKNGQPLYPVYAYRDDRTQAVLDEVHSILPFAQLYARTGIQFQPFNSIYQLYADKKAGRLAQAEDFLMIPEYLLWKLCGVKAREYTNATYTRIFDVNAARFSAPQDMRAEIRTALAETGEAPATDADLINSIYHSLAYCYGEAFRELEALTGQHWDKLYIAGGGAKNATLNELTAHYTGKQVVALPIEATAIGNLKIQMSISEGGTV